jgi:hypothetical protein
MDLIRYFLHPKAYKLDDLQHQRHHFYQMVVGIVTFPYTFSSAPVVVERLGQPLFEQQSLIGPKPLLKVVYRVQPDAERQQCY